VTSCIGASDGMHIDYHKLRTDVPWMSVHDASSFTHETVFFAVLNADTSVLSSAKIMNPTNI